MAAVYIVVGNPDIGGLFYYDLVGGTRILLARSLVDRDTAAFCCSACLLDTFLVLIRH